MKRLSIGQMAKMNRVSEKALRLYHENGILVPAYVDESSGRRYYDIQQSTKLDMILQLQQMGFSLSEIVEINERQSMEYLQEKAAARQQIYDRGYSLTLFGNMGTLIPQEGLEAGRPVKEYTFAYVSEEFGECFKESEVLPGGQYLSLYLYQAYDHGRELDSERLLRMRDYAYNKKMVIAGDAFGESLCRYPRFFDSGDFLLYRLCVPVRPA